MCGRVKRAAAAMGRRQGCEVAREGQCRVLVGGEGQGASHTSPYCGQEDSRFAWSRSWGGAGHSHATARLRNKAELSADPSRIYLLGLCLKFGVSADMSDVISKFIHVEVML